MTTRILIIGAGAVGAFYGSRLALAPNVLVSALCRSNFAAVKAQGFKITSPKYGDYAFKPEHVFPNVQAARESVIHWDYLLVSTKALPGVSDDSELLTGLVGDKTSIVLAQNGIGIERPYAARFSNAPILSAVTIVSAAQPEPGSIKHNGWTRISIGPYLPHLDNADATPLPRDSQAQGSSQKLASLLRQGDIADAEAHSHSDLQFIRWHKLAINAAMNPSAVLSGGSTTRQMSLDANMREHLLGVMREILALAPVVLGRPLRSHLASPELIIESTKRNSEDGKPSMVADWDEGRVMELEVILGEAVRAAKQKRVEVPRVQTMYALLKMAQQNREDRPMMGKL